MNDIEKIEQQIALMEKIGNQGNALAYLGIFAQLQCALQLAKLNAILTSRPGA